MRHSQWIAVCLLSLALGVYPGPGVSDENKQACAEALLHGGEGTWFQKVGSTRLRVLLFRVYDAAFFTPSGRYDDSEARLLRLHYLRNFSAAQLVEQTRSEWERLGFSLDEQADSWLETLQDIWPDVAPGQCLVAHSQADSGTSFFGVNGYLGTIHSDQFSDQFLAIWLSENARYRHSRDELVGLSR